MGKEPPPDYFKDRGDQERRDELSQTVRKLSKKQLRALQSKDKLAKQRRQDLN